MALNLLIILLSACKKDIKHPAYPNDLLSFNFTTGINPSLFTNNLSCTISDTLVTGLTSTAINRSALVATFTTNGATVTVNDVPQVSGVTKNNFTNPVVYIVTSQEGLKKEYTVKLASFTGLPVLYITTEAPVVSKDDYVNGTMKIDGNLQYTDGKFQENIDAESFINWFLVNEIMRNRDAIMYSSVYFYKDKSGKLSMGPRLGF